MRMLLMVSLAITLAMQGAVAEYAPSIFYKAQKDNKTIYLLGSIHIGNESMYPLRDNIIKAMDSADSFVFECDTSNITDVAKARALMYLPQGESLSSMLKADTMANLESLCNKINLNINAISNLKPWAVYSMLSLNTAKELLHGSSVDLAVDNHVKNYALNNQKPLYFAETALEQYQTLDGLSLNTQELILNELINNNLYGGSSNFDASIDNWPEWFKSNNAKAFADAYNADLSADMQEFNHALLTRRNILFASYLNNLVQNNEKVFATFGLLHIVLKDNSVVYELARLGYEISPM